MRRSARRLAVPAAAPARGQSRALEPDALGDHLDRLYAAAWAMCGSREDAEDLVQDTYARVLARRRLLRGDDALPYLLRVLRNTHVSRLRAAARRPVSDRGLHETEAVDPRSASRPESVLEQRELFAAIASLPAAQRDALIAVDVAGLSYREAGRALRVKEATITTRLHRARRAVAELLVVAPEAGAPATARAPAAAAMPHVPQVAGSLAGKERGT